MSNKYLEKIAELVTVNPQQSYALFGVPVLVPNNGGAPQVLQPKYGGTIINGILRDVTGILPSRPHTNVNQFIPATLGIRG